MLRIMSFPINIMKSIVGGSMEFYYEKETVVGRWFNNKNIYAQSFDIPQPTDQYAITSTGEIDGVIFQVGTIDHFNNKSYPYPYHTTIYVQVKISNGNIIIENSDNTMWKNLKCTIFYTKIND